MLFGDIAVTVEKEVLSENHPGDFLIRTVQVEREGMKREILQFHY